MPYNTHLTETTDAQQYGKAMSFEEQFKGFIIVEEEGW